MFIPRIALPVAVVVLASVAMATETTTSPVSRTHGGQFTAAKLVNARANVARYDWARVERDKALAKAAKWVEIPDDALWKMVPGQKLPRTIDVTWDYNHPEKPTVGCIECGDKIFKHGNYPYSPDFTKKPWKLTCPNCGVVMPTNDFGKYYESGLDEHGLFDPARADKSLLFNTTHPDPADPLQKYGVDDGFGAIDKNGRAHKFIGYYAWKYWRELIGGVGALADAFIYTGDARYAHKAAILIDRISDVYPDMDWKPYALRGWYHSDGRTKTGKIEGSIWETGMISVLARGYDAIQSGTEGDEALFRFLGEIGARYKLAPKGSRELFLRNVDDNLLRCARQAILDERIMGNFGMRQRTMAVLALALNQDPETSQWIDWCFSPEGGDVKGGIVSRVDRDGVGDEGAPHYAIGVWAGSLGPFADLIVERRNLYAELPHFRRLFTAGWRMSVLDWTMPNIGDSASTGYIGRTACELPSVLRPFLHAGDPESAVAAFELNGNKADGLGQDIFAADPQGIERAIAAAAKDYRGHRRDGGRHLPGYGLASLESGRGPDGKAVWLYYGRNTGHGHQDRLNFGIYAYGVDLTPDLGYPEFAGGNSEQVDWNQHTVSHNALLVDNQAQKDSWTGYPLVYKRLPGLGVMQIDGGGVYDGVSLYRRTMLQVECPGDHVYVVDLMEAKGGSDHLLSFHGAPGQVEARGLSFQKQPGTFAGGDVARRSVGKPFSYLENVERATSCPDSFQLDWKVEAGYRGVRESDNVHLKWHVVTPCDEISLADGIPPQNKAGNPKALRYALLRRRGANLVSQFLSVLEPYKEKPFLRGISREPVPGGEDAVVLKVEHLDGTVDRIIVSDTRSSIAVGGIKTDGLVSFVRENGGTCTRTAIVGGRNLDVAGRSLTLDAPEFTGRVVNIDKEDMEDKAVLSVDSELPTDGSLNGEFITIANDGVRSACYEIYSVKRDGNSTRVFCGPVTFIRGFKNPSDPKAGFVYDFEIGAPFKIVRHAAWATTKSD